MHNDDSLGPSTPQHDAASGPASGSVNGAHDTGLPNGRSREGASGRRLALVSCTGPMRAQPSRARDVFLSPLFKELCAYAEREADAWFLLSAEHGLLDPETVITPTATGISRKDSAARREWARLVIEQLTPHLSGVERVLVLANARAREFLLDFLSREGREVEVPMDGLSLGEQLQWLRKQNGGTPH